MIIVVAIWIDIARFWLDRCPTNGVNQMEIVVCTGSGFHTRGVMNHHVCIENRETFSLLHVGHDSWRYSVGAVREKSGNAVIWDDGVVSTDQGSKPIDAATAIVLEVSAGKNNFIVGPAVGRGKSVSESMVGQVNREQPGLFDELGRISNDMFTAGTAAHAVPL